MKVALVTENLAFGGINRYCMALAQGFREYPGVDLELMALPSQGDDWLLREAAELGVAVRVLTEHPVRSLRQMAATGGVDVIHSQGYRSNLTVRAALLRGRSPVKSLCTVHGAYYFNSAPSRSKVYYALDYLTMFRSDRVLAVSAATAAKISRWARRARVSVIHNGTDVPVLPSETEKAAARMALGIPAQAKVVCFVGRYDPQKGIDALCRAMTQVLSDSPDTLFLLVGDGGLRTKLEACARGFGPRVLMIEPQRDVGPHYLAADILFLPSRTEGLPMTLLEAFALGVPAVASNVGGVPEVLVEGCSGFLCDRDDPDTMAKRILQLAGDDALRAAMGANARETVLTGLTVPAMVGATYRAYLALGEANE